MLTYFLKMIIRNKTALFWGFFFPIALMLLFKITFGNIVSTENSLDERNVAVVLQGEGLYQDNFKAMMDEIAEGTGTDELNIKVEYTDLDTAAEKLDSKKVDFYYVVSDEEVEVHLGEKYGIATGMIAREIADTYKVNMAIIDECMTSDPSKMEEVAQSLQERISYISLEDKEGIDIYMWYYISTLVMGILFDYSSGIRVLAAIRADVSGSAMRVAISSSSKTKMVLSCLLAQLILSLSKTAVHILFMQFVIGIDILSKAGLVAIGIASATVFSICLGILLGMFFKGDAQARENKSLGIVMLSVFISGEMIVTLPGYIEKFAPIVNRINPATLFNKIFYRILLCENTGDLMTNIAIITAASVLMLVVSIIILRRETYASL